MIFEQLFESFGQLEKAIRTAKAALVQSNPDGSEVIERLESYQEILEKQRELAKSLTTFAGRHDWAEVARHIKIINALSQMIRDDAVEIISQAQPGSADALKVEKTVQ